MGVSKLVSRNYFDNHSYYFNGEESGEFLYKKPHISILSSVFNCRPYIGKTIDSVLNQTYENWEWVILDDGSTDGTGNIIKSVNDKRIRYVFHEHAASQHIAKKYNKALLMCKGDILAMIDGDDYWPCNKLQVQVKSFDDPTVVLSYGESYLINNKGRKIGYVGIPEDRSTACNNPVGSVLNILLMEKSCFIVHPTVMLRKNVLLKIGGFAEVKGMGEDFPTWVRLALEGGFLAMPVCLGYYRKHASSLSIMQDPQDAFDDETKFLKDFVLAFGDELNCLGLHYDMERLRSHWEEIRMYIPYNSARYMLMFGSFNDARSEFRKFLTKAPSLKNNLIYYLIILSSYFKTDMVNPIVYFKERIKSLKKQPGCEAI